jgi:hypothetical protein
MIMMKHETARKCRTEGGCFLLLGFCKLSWAFASSAGLLQAQLGFCKLSQVGGFTAEHRHTATVCMFAQQALPGWQPLPSACCSGFSWQRIFCAAPDLKERQAELSKAEARQSLPLHLAGGKVKMQRAGCQIVWQKGLPTGQHGQSVAVSSCPCTCHVDL